MSRNIDIKKKWMKKLNLYGLTNKDFNLKKEALSRKFNKNATDSDVIWGLFQNLTAKITDLQELKGLYYEKALFLNYARRECEHKLKKNSKFGFCRCCYASKYDF